MVQDSDPNKRLEILHGLALGLLNDNDLQTMLDRVSRTILDEVQGFDCAIMLYEPSHQQLICHSYVQKDPQIDISSLKLKPVQIGAGVIGTVAKTQKTMLIQDTRECPFYVVNIQENLSELCVPIVYTEQLIGIIDMEHPQENFFARSDAKFVEMLASMIAGLIRNQQSNEKLKLAVDNLEFTKRQLREKEDNYKNLLEQAGDGIFIHDSTGRFVEVNEQAVLSLGYSRQELLRMRVQDIDIEISKEPHAISNLHKSLRPGQPRVVQGVHQRKDGSKFPVEVKVSLMENNYVIAVARDISKRMEIKTELDKTKDFMQEVVNTSPDVIYVFDLTKNLVINGGDRFSKFLGYIENQFTTWQSVLDHTHPEDRPGMIDRANKILASKEGEIVQSEARLRRVDGSWVWIQNHCKVSKRDANGRPLLEVGTVSDITKSKNVESKLVHSESYYKALVENSYDGIVLHDHLGNIKFVSNGALKLLDYQEQDVIGKVGKAFTHEDDISIPIEGWKWILEHPKQPYKTKPYRMRNSHGDYIWVEHTMTNLLADPIVNAVVSNFIDITDKKIAEQSVAKREKYFRSLVENAFDGIVLYDKTAHIKFVSNSVARLLGYNSIDTSNRVGIDFVYSEDRHYAEQAWQWILQHPGEPYRIPDYRLVKKDGTLMWVENTLTNLLDDSNVQGIISNFRDISHKKIAEQSIYRISNYDSLTELPNRTFLKKQLERQINQARRELSTISLLYFDIVQLNSINNALGHMVGDQVLHYVAKCIRQNIDEFDFIARSGNDEFAVILSDKDAYEASKVAEKILTNFDNVIHIADMEVKVTLRAGIARYPDDADNHQDLLSKAEIAVNRVKNLPGQYAFFQQQDSETISYKLNLERELVKAIKDDSLELYYQPKVCLKTGKIQSVEALLRWNHPERGFISPQVIINIAEESELIHRLTRWVIATAANQIHQWQQQDIHTKVAINLSPQDLQQEGFEHDVFNLLKQYQVDNSCLEIEITESAAMADMDKSIRVLKRLADKGIGVGLDDFGTGYSSISYLTSLPVDLVKIDQSFIHGLHDKKRNSQYDNELIIENIINLAESFKLLSLVEGIETYEQCKLLQKLNCDLGQGYLFSKPLPAQQIQKLLALGFVDFEEYNKQKSVDNETEHASVRHDKH
ncbi:MAG: EAL domain-containing protein [Kangiellaceae bacterium]|nr:EAL domain-containing protein [Kangiellaceae bacterium]